MPGGLAETLHAYSDAAARPAPPRMGATTVEPDTSAADVSHARMRMLGTRWVLPILMQLARGPLRFGDLKRNLPGVSSNVLTRRLRELEAAGLASRFALSGSRGVTAYRTNPAAGPPLALLEMIEAWADGVPSRSAQIGPAGREATIGPRSGDL